VYCRLDFAVPSPTHGSRSSWERIVNDVTIVNLQNIALCCVASKGRKELLRWLDSDYCRRKGITANPVAQVVQEALANRSPC
jgi:hypothetical protein